MPQQQRLPWLAAPLAILLAFPLAADAQEPDHDAHHPPATQAEAQPEQAPGNMAAMMAKMMEARKQLAADLAKLDAELQTKIEAMQTATGEARIDAMAAVITTLVLLGQVLELRARSQTGAAIIALRRKMQRDHHVSFVFSSHDPQVLAEAMVPKVPLMRPRQRAPMVWAQSSMRAWMASLDQSLSPARAPLNAASGSRISGLRCFFAAASS